MPSFSTEKLSPLKIKTNMTPCYEYGEVTSNHIEDCLFNQNAINMWFMAAKVLST